MFQLKLLTLLAATTLLIGVCAGQNAAPTTTPAATMPATYTAPAQPPQSAPAERPAETQGLSITHHQVTIKGQTLRYTATAGLLPTTGPDGGANAEIFFVAYSLDGADAATRPITFAFNGGPGASSMYLHMGAMGPQRAELGKEGLSLPKTLALVDNDDGWLDFTDLVFVDPVGTGYSRPANGAKPKEFYSLHSDVQSLGEFIRLYVTRYERWLSPKFLAGESYGATRAVELSGYLQKHSGLYLDGLVLLSSPLNFQLIQFGPGNDLPCALYLPTYTAAAFYHKKLPADLQEDLAKSVREAEQYAMNEYSRALAAGDTLDETQRAQVIKQLSRLTGLSEETIRQADLRLSGADFSRELFKNDKRMLGLYDSRVAGPASEVYSVLDDPSLSLVIGPFAATIQQYIRQDLRYQTNWPYVFLSGEISRMWDWDTGKGGSLNVSPTLTQAMIVNANLRVFMAAGRYDLVTSYFSQQYAAGHLGLPKAVRPHLQLHVYESGHQLYTDPAARAKLHADVGEFFQKR